MAHALSAKFTQSIATRALANTRNTRHTARLTTVRPMASITIVDGVDFTHIAREFRCKWSADNDKASLAAAQKVLNKHLPALKAKGEVQRTVCGGCLDFKVNRDCLPKTLARGKPLGSPRKLNSWLISPRLTVLRTLKHKRTR